MNLVGDVAKSSYKQIFQGPSSTITHDGIGKIDQATMDNLQTLLEDAFMSATDKKLYLRADKELEYGKIVDIIEILKDSGVDIVGIITEKKTTKSD